MENAETILVIFLSGALAVFLTLGIILLVICIKIAKRVRKISEKAEAITEKAENIADFVSKAATPLAIGKMFSSLRDTVTGKSGKGKKG